MQRVVVCCAGLMGEAMSNRCVRVSMRFVVIFVVGCLYMHAHVCVCMSVILPFFDGYCSTVQGLLDWFET